MHSSKRSGTGAATALTSRASSTIRTGACNVSADSLHVTLRRQRRREQAWDHAVTRMTMRWPRASSGSTRPSSSAIVVRGAVSTTSSSPPSSGSIGSTTAASSKTTAAYHPSNSKAATTARRADATRLRLTPASLHKPGAVQLVSRHGREPDIENYRAHARGFVRLLLGLVHRAPGQRHLRGLRRVRIVGWEHRASGLRSDSGHRGCPSPVGIRLVRRFPRDHRPTRSAVGDGRNRSRRQRHRGVPRDLCGERRAADRQRRTERALVGERRREVPRQPGPCVAGRADEAAAAHPGDLLRFAGPVQRSGQADVQVAGVLAAGGQVLDRPPVLDRR